MARKRTIATVLLLSASPLTLAAAAAARSASSTPAASTAAAPTAGRPAPGAATDPLCDDSASRTPPPDDKAPAELVALRSKLYEAGRAGGRSQQARFRPLCDREGYPLVGNVANKTDLYQPSEFCADVRRSAR